MDKSGRDNVNVQNVTILHRMQKNITLIQSHKIRSSESYPSMDPLRQHCRHYKTSNGLCEKKS